MKKAPKKRQTPNREVVRTTTTTTLLRACVLPTTCTSVDSGTSQQQKESQYHKCCAYFVGLNNKHILITSSYEKTRIGKNLFFIAPEGIERVGVHLVIDKCLSTKPSTRGRHEKNIPKQDKNAGKNVGKNPKRREGYKNWKCDVLLSPAPSCNCSFVYLFKVLK